jgi:hypothetical protein
MRAEDRIAARLLEALEALEGLDLTSADGRAGIHTLLSEIERACPGVLLQQAARMELRAVGWRGCPSTRVPSVDVEPGVGRSALSPGG